MARRESSGSVFDHRPAPPRRSIERPSPRPRTHRDERVNDVVLSEAAHQTQIVSPRGSGLQKSPDQPQALPSQYQPGLACRDKTHEMKEMVVRGTQITWIQSLDRGSAGRKRQEGGGLAPGEDSQQKPGIMDEVSPFSSLRRRRKKWRGPEEKKRWTSVVLPRTSLAAERC